MAAEFGAIVLVNRDDEGATIRLANFGGRVRV